MYRNGVNIDKFGSTSWNNVDNTAFRRTIGFPLTIDGDYDIQGRKLSNVQRPRDGDDCAIKQYVDEIHNILKNEINKYEGEMSSKIKIYHRKVSTVETTPHKNKQKFDNVKDQLATITSEIQNVQAAITDHSKFIDDVSYKVDTTASGIKNEIKRISSETGTLESKLAAEKQNLQQISNRLNALDTLKSELQKVEVSITDHSKFINDVSARVDNTTSGIINEIKRISAETGTIESKLTTEIRNLQDKINKDITLNLKRISNRLDSLDTLTTNVRMNTRVIGKRVDDVVDALNSRIDKLEKNIRTNP